MQTDVLVQDKFVTLNGLRFHYRDWGSEDAVPVVVLHGNTGQHVVGTDSPPLWPTSAAC